MKRIAVISGGVRSAAIAAKADVINLLQPGSLDIVIFEPVEIGANWNGSNGYTDGRQRLCTEIERDLGFPYTTDLFPSSIDNQLVDDLMLKEYSWQAFNVGNGSAYPEWISRGGPPPTHYEFASYLRWVVVKTGFSVIPEMAQRLEFDTAQAKWTVITGSTRETDFDGVVVTGTRPRTDHYCFPASPLAPYIANTVDFWQRIPAIHDLLRDAANLHSVAVVGIVGTGAAAATITAHFLRRVCEIEDDPSKLLEIQLIGRSPFVAPRHPNYFQDRVFHDSTAWKAVPNKREFIDQALFGSVWTSLVDMISADTRVTTDTMAVRGARFLNPSYTARPATVVLEGDDPLSPGATKTSKAMAFIVDARGQRIDWFLDRDPRRPRLDFLEAPLHAALSSSAPSSTAMRDHISANLKADFSIDLAGFPPGLHVPMLGSEIGPGATNLMALGWVSDSVLDGYI